MTKSKQKKSKLIKPLILMGIGIGAISVACAYGAAEVSDIAGAASDLRGALAPMAKLISASAVVAGLGFSMASIFKFKAHKDNPQQIPIGTPIALLFIAVALLYLPFLFKTLGKQTFGSGASAASISGISDLNFNG